MKKHTKFIGGGLLALALAGGGAGTAAALAGPPTAARATTAPATAATADIALAGSSARPGHGHRRALLGQLRRLFRHSEHAELLVTTPNRGEITVDVDKGTLTTISTSSIEITRPDGTAVSATITPSTHFFGLAESKLGPGDRVLLVQTGGNAVDVGALPPKPASSAAA